MTKKAHRIDEDFCVDCNLGIEDIADKDECVPTEHKQMKHTPTPWAAWPNASYPTIRICQLDKDGEGQNVARVSAFHGREKLTDAQVADAAFIVRACNAHDALLEALNDCSEICHDLPNGEGDLALSAACKNAREAITLARKE